MNRIMAGKGRTKAVIGGGIILLVPAVILGWVTVSHVRTIAYWQTRAAGFPTVNELRAPQVADSENAATVYRQGWQLLALSDEEQHELQSSRDPRVLAPLLERNREALLRLHEAAMMEQCRFEPVKTDTPFGETPHLKLLRKLAALAAAETVVALAHDDVKAACEAVCTRLAVAAHLLQAPCGFIEFLYARFEIQRAMQSLELILAHSALEARDTAALREALDRLNPHDALLIAYKVEMAESLEYLKDPLGFVRAAEGRSPPANPAVMAFLHWNFRMNRARYMQIHTLELERLPRPWRKTATLEPLTPPDGALYTWIQLAPPHFSKLGAVRDEMLAGRELMRTALDVSEFLATHGRLPETLEKLPQAADSTWAFDPFSGTRLRYEPKTGGAYRLWSIGRNLRDNGGIPFQEAREARKALDEVPDGLTEEFDIIFNVAPAGAETTP